jgi:hypothetical protein
MRRLALPIAAVIALSGLAVVSVPRDQAHASDLPVQPTQGQCLATSPFMRSAPLAQRVAFSLDERKTNGDLVSSRGITKQDGSGLASIAAPSAAPLSAGLAASTSAQLTGKGAESIVRVTGAKGAVPSVTIDSYPTGEPTTASRTSTPVNGMALPPADANAVTANNFLNTTDADYVAHGLVAEPDEVAVAWRSPYDANNAETINVRLYQPTSDGLGLLPYGGTYSLSGQFQPIQNAAQDVLAITTADMDLDGDPEIILAYQWGGSYAPVRVAVLNISDPGNPILSLVAQMSYPVVNPIVSQITVGAGLFGEPATQIALGWQETDPAAYRAPAQVRTLVLTHQDGQKPLQLTAPANGMPQPLIQTGSRSFTTETSDGWKTSTFALAVGDIDEQPTPPGTSIFEAGKDEIVVAHSDGIYLRTLVLDPSTTGLTTKMSTSDSAISGQYAPRGITLGVADMDSSGNADIAVAYTNSAGTHRLMWYAASDDRTQLALMGTMTPQLGASPGNPLPIVMPDVGNQSVRMRQRLASADGPACRDVKAPIMLSAADAAPFWDTPGHMNWWGYSTVGSSKDVSFGKEHTVNHTQSNDVTWTYPGIDIEGSIGILEWEFEARVDYDVSWGSSWANTSSQSNSYSLSKGFSNFGANTQGQYALVDYRCFYYDVDTPAGRSSVRTRACVPIDANDPDFDPAAAFVTNASTGVQDAFGWETGAEPSAPPSDYAWAPYRDEWTNMTLNLPPSAATQSSDDGYYNAGRAIDGNKDTLNSAAITAVQTDPWWQVKLNASEDIGLVRVYPGSVPLCGESTCEDMLHDFDVYVFNDDSLANASAAQLKSAGVVPFHFAGTPAKVANMVTRMGSTNVAARGKYVRIQMTSPMAFLQLAEVQVYPADDEQLPPEYPSAVRALTAQEKSGLADKNVFAVSVWDAAQRKYVEKFISGELVPMSPAPNWTTINSGACDAYQEGSWSSSDATDKTFEESTDRSGGVGASADLSAGFTNVKVTSSPSYMHHWGTETSSSQTTSVGKSFTIGWGRGNYCYRDATTGNYVQGYTTAAACSYKMKPFYYMQEEWSNSGYQQLFPHVSYVVDMDRSKDLSDCYDDHWRYGANIAPQAPDLTVAIDSSALQVDPLAGATDANPEDQGRLVIRGVTTSGGSSIPASSMATAAGGTATVTNGKVTYQPPSGSWSSPDTFYVTISDHDLNSLPIKVSVYHSGVTNGGFSDQLAGWATTGGGVSIQEQEGGVVGKFARFTVLGTGGTTTLSQSLAVPSSGTGKLVLYRRGIGAEALWNGQSSGHDTLQLAVTSGGTTQVLDTVSDKDVTGDWTRYEYDLSGFKGKAVELKFTASGPNDGYTTYFDLDEISLPTTADHWIARVNAGGTTLPANDSGPGWAPDTASQPSPYHNGNSNTSDWGNLSITRGANLPASTPTAIFSSERWSPNDSPNMQWNFLAPTGHHLTVRLYFSNGYSGTSQPGQRKFDVVIDGTTVLNDYDIVADVGNRVGTMKSFNVTSDGIVDIDFSHVLENPLINGIEIIDNDVPAP